MMKLSWPLLICTKYDFYDLVPILKIFKKYLTPFLKIECTFQALNLICKLMKKCVLIHSLNNFLTCSHIQLFFALKNFLLCFLCKKIFFLSVQYENNMWLGIAIAIILFCSFFLIIQTNPHENFLVFLFFATLLHFWENEILFCSFLVLFISLLCLCYKQQCVVET